MKLNSEVNSADSSVQYIFALILIVVLASVFLMALVQISAESPGRFTVVDSDPENATIDETETVDIAATITNSGNAIETQVIELTLGENTKRVSLTLEPGDTETVWLRGTAADSLGLGNTTYSVRTKDDTRTSTLRVTSERPAVFELSNLKPEQITLGDRSSVNISAEIENTGGKTGTQAVAMRVGNETVAKQNVTLRPGENESFTVYNVHLAWLEPGERTFSIRSTNERLNGTVLVPTPPTLEFREIDPGDATIDRMAQVQIALEIENTGDLGTTQTGILSIDGELVQSETLSVQAGSQDRLVFDNITASQFGVGVHRYQISIGDVTVIRSLTIEGEQPARYEVTRLAASNTTVQRDGSFDVIGTIRNTGEQTANETITVEFDGRERVRTSKEIPPGESIDFDVFNLSVAGYPPGEYRYSLSTRDDTEKATVEIID